VSKRPDLRIVDAHPAPVVRNVIQLNERRYTKPSTAPIAPAQPRGCTWCDLVLHMEPPRPSRRKPGGVEEL